MATDLIADGGGYPGHWRGRFVWYGDERHPFHRFLMARRAFELPAAPRRARLAVTAEDRFLLYVNGTYLGRRAAAWFERQHGSDNVLYQLPKETFIDWMPHDMRGASFALNVLYSRFLAVLGDLAESLGKPDEAASWRADAGRLREHLRASHWDEGRGLFVDSVFEGELSRTVSELSNGMALVFGIADDRQTARIAAHLEQPPDDLLRTTPLILFLVLEGLAAAGRTDLAVRLMRDRYAPMMAATDAPTMWESWSMFVRERGAMTRAESRFTTEPQFASPSPYSGELTGLVHSSSVAPAWTLSRHDLGILPDPHGRRDGGRRRAVPVLDHPAPDRRSAPDRALAGNVNARLL